METSDVAGAAKSEKEKEKEIRREKCEFSKTKK